MPGDNLLRQEVAWDGPTASWSVIQALDVPARGGTVAEYYTHVLRSHGFAVHPTAGAPDPGGYARLLHARKTHLHVQVSVRQAASELVSRVRLIWRAWEAGRGGAW